MSEQIPGGENLYLNIFNSNLKNLGINKEYTVEDFTSIFLNSEKDENGNVSNEIFLDNLLKDYNMSHESVIPETMYNLLFFNHLDGDRSSISKSDLENAFNILLNDVSTLTPAEWSSQIGDMDETYYPPEILNDEIEYVDDEPQDTNVNNTENYEVEEGKALTPENKAETSFKETSKVKQNENGEYYVDVEKYDGNHSKNGCVWDIVYNSYDLSGVNVSWTTLKEAIYKANGGEKRLHPGDKIILPPLEDIIAGTVKSPDERNTDASTVSSQNNTMEQSGNLEVTGEVSDNEKAKAHLNDYLYVFDKTNPDDVEQVIDELITDEEVSISDKMKILNTIYNDSEVDNKSVIKSYFEKSDKFFADALNEIANNRDKYSYGDLKAFVSRYSIYNPGGSFTAEDTPDMINAWVNVLNTAQSQDEIDDITSRRFRNPEENGMLTLSEAIYTYLPDKASELEGNVLAKSAEKFADKTTPADYGIEDARASELTEKYGNDFNGVLKAIVDLRNSNGYISNNELLYLIQNSYGGDMSSFIEDINALPQEVQKAVYAVLQEAYKNEGNAFELLDNVSRSSDRDNYKAEGISYGYANTIRNYLNRQTDKDESLPT